MSAMDGKELAEFLQRQMGVDGVRRGAKSLEKMAEESTKAQKEAAKRDRAEAARASAEADRSREEAATLRAQRRVFEEEAARRAEAARLQAELRRKQENCRTLIAQTEYMLPKVAALEDAPLKYCLTMDYLSEARDEFSEGVNYLDMIHEKQNCLRVVGGIDALRGAVAGHAGEFHGSLLGRYWQEVQGVAPLAKRYAELEQVLTAKMGKVSTPMGCLMAFFGLAGLGALVSVFAPHPGMARSEAVLGFLCCLGIFTLIGRKQLWFLVRGPSRIREMSSLQQQIKRHPVQGVVAEVKKKYPEWADIITRKLATACQAQDVGAVDRARKYIVSRSVLWVGGFAGLFLMALMGSFVETEPEQVVAPPPQAKPIAPAAVIAPSPTNAVTSERPDSRRETIEMASVSKPAESPITPAATASPEPSAVDSLPTVDITTNLLIQIAGDIKGTTDPDRKAKLTALYSLGCSYLDYGKQASSAFEYLRKNYPNSEYLSYFKADSLSEPCSTCSGSGFSDRPCWKCKGQANCSVCGGAGSRTVAALNTGTRTVSCTACNGSGKCRECAGTGTQRQECPRCHGKGVSVSKEKTREAFVALYARTSLGQSK